MTQGKKKPEAYIDGYVSFETDPKLAIAEKQSGYKTLIFEYMDPNVRSTNGDRTTNEELKKSAHTAVGALVDIDHDFGQSIGSIISPLEVPDVGRPIAIAKISSVKFPNEVSEIERRIGNGKMPVSWETLFESARCSECSAEMGEDTPYSVFINHCRTEHPDIDPLTICRDLSGLTHQGVGILFTKSPGFPGVEALAIASSQQEEGGDIMNENEKKLFDELEAIKASMSTLEAENATHKETISRMETEKAQEASTKEVETLTASLAEASTKIESLASALEAEKKINEDTKAEIAQNEKINSYFAKAETLGVKFSEEEATTLRSDTFKRWKEEDVDMFLGVKKAALAVASSNHTEVPNPAEATKAIIPEHKSTLQAVSSEFDVTNIKFKL